MSEEGREYLGCLEAAIKNNAYRVKNCKKVLEKQREEIERIQNSIKLIQQESEKLFEHYRRKKKMGKLVVLLLLGVLLLLRVLLKKM
ncbi:hypothetical protein WN944_018786 [Citrus x changshan-huyou]|uniref:Uncharacterized protein n=1 Tax=Citrus x changshan-huyou TaxID=2935761 RepID=A0AAP0LWY6_9ROSI